MSDLSGSECNKALVKMGLIYGLFLPMVALSMTPIMILFKAIFEAPLSLTADAIYAYYKYVIFSVVATCFAMIDISCSHRLRLYCVVKNVLRYFALKIQCKLFNGKGLMANKA